MFLAPESAYGCASDFAAASHADGACNSSVFAAMYSPVFHIRFEFPASSPLLPGGTYPQHDTILAVAGARHRHDNMRSEADDLVVIILRIQHAHRLCLVLPDTDVRHFHHSNVFRVLCLSPPLVLHSSHSPECSRVYAGHLILVIRSCRKSPWGCHTTHLCGDFMPKPHSHGRPWRKHRFQPCASFLAGLAHTRADNRCCDWQPEVVRTSFLA